MARYKTIPIVVTLVITITLAITGLALERGDRAAGSGVSSASPVFDHEDQRSTTTDPGDRTGHRTTPAPSEQRPAANDELEGRGEPVHEVLPGAGGPPPTSPTDPIGDLDDDRPVPAGLDFTAPPDEHYDTAGLSGADDLATAPSCSHQCITKGVAYARGFGAELVIETSVPVKFFITAIADLDDDGDYEDAYVESTSFGLTSHSWALDHLAPGETYHAMAAATDEDGHTAYVWGAFTTLSQRDVYVELGSATIFGGPGGITSNAWLLGLDGPHTNVSPGQQGILLYYDVARQVDIAFMMLRGWDDKLCESFPAVDSIGKQGHSSDWCVAWNSAFVEDLDLDVVPAGKTRWTQTAVQLSLHPPTGAGDPLPPGFGDPYYFYFEVPTTIHVNYS